MTGITIAAILAALGQHHGEADPTLLQWIMEALSHILVGTLGFTELTIVIIIGIIIIAMPALIFIAYWGEHPPRFAKGSRPAGGGRRAASAFGVK